AIRRAGDHDPTHQPRPGRGGAADRQNDPAARPGRARRRAGHGHGGPAARGGDGVCPPRRWRRRPPGHAQGRLHGAGRGWVRPRHRGRVRGVGRRAQLWRRRGGRRAGPFLTAEPGQDPWTLAELQESWLRCGRSVLEWYQLTPRETLQVLDAELTREQHAHERAAWSTSYNARTPRAKRKPG